MVFGLAFVGGIQGVTDAIGQVDTGRGDLHDVILGRHFEEAFHGVLGLFQRFGVVDQVENFTVMGLQKFS